MEEEIIIPEEETFDYSKLRYILDRDGYVCHASVGGFIVCDLGACTEYNGKVPSGYSTLDEWYDVQIITKKLNAWKIVEGNLVYDPNRDYKLTLQYEQDAKDYKNVTYKELGLTTSEQEKAYNDLFPSHSAGGKEIASINAIFNYVGNLPTEEVKIKGNNITGLIELEFIGSNYLPNTASSGSNNGINYKVETDKKITISGIATAKSTFNLAGSDTSLRKILTFKRKDYDDDTYPNDTLNYLISGLDENTNLEFYYYDGTERTLVGAYNNGLITFDNDTPVTQVVLTIESGIAINTTIAPMLRIAPTDNNYPYIEMTKNDNGEYVYTNELSFFTAEAYQTAIENMLYTITTPTEVSSLTSEYGGFVIESETLGGMFFSYNTGEKYDYIGCKCSIDVKPYEEYKNNYTLIDLGENTLTLDDTLKLRDNKIILIKNDYTTISADDVTVYHGEEIYLGDVVMPKTYEPATEVYSHQQVDLVVIYKDPRNIDITKISLKGLIQTMDIESVYNFGEADYTKVRNYIMGETTLTNEEYELYDINGDGMVTDDDLTLIKFVSYNYTTEDVDKIISYANGETTLTPEELKIYDMNYDGVVDKVDAASLLRILYEYNGATIKGTLEINTTSSQRTIVLRDEQEKIKTSIGLNGITTPSLSIGGSPIIESGSNDKGNYIKYSDGTMICTQKIELTNISISTTWGSWYVYAESSDNYHYFPKKFAEVYSFSIELLNQGSSSGFMIGDYGRRQVDLDKWTGLTLIRPTSATKVNATLCATAIGRWDADTEKPDTPTADLVKTISANGSRGNHKFTLQVNETGTSGNSSLMSYTFKLSPVKTGWDWAGWSNSSRTVSYTITIGNNTYSGKIPDYDGYSTVTVKSGSNIAIEHDVNGTKTIDIGFTVTDTAGQSYTSGNASASDTMILTKTS